MAFILLWYYWVMTLDIKTIPPVVIEPGIYGSVEITLDGDYYYLKHSGIEWHIYTIPNMREYHEECKVLLWYEARTYVL
jgi:hypothetical protein